MTRKGKGFYSEREKSEACGVISIRKWRRGKYKIVFAHSSGPVFLTRREMKNQIPNWEEYL